jgi:T3SS negative regulator,GrlR
MALDALWTVELEARVRSTNGGVIVLKNGHILGGNNTHYYVGTFTTGGTMLKGQVRIAWYSGSRQTAWGDEAEVVEAKVTGEAGGPNTITGKVSRSGHPDMSFRMAKQAELP